MDRYKRKSRRNVVGFSKSSGKSLKRVLMSVISFVVVFVLLTSMTFSWFSIKTSEFRASYFQLDCGKGLRVNDSGTSQLSFSQTNNYLIPASSVTGRNLYFPTDGSDFSSTTELMTFRSANAGDKNQNYIQIDFTLTAQQNHTALYINEEKTSIEVKNSAETNWSIPQAAALRSALWSSTAESGVPNTPIVFNPTASTVRTAAVEDVDNSTGAFISSGRQVAHAFSDYSFGGEPVATLSKGVETKFSYIIWLEGTDPKCTDKILAKDIQVKLAFTTSWDKTQTIRFEDGTGNNAIKTLLYRNENPYSLTLRYYEVEMVNGNEQQALTYTDFNMYKYNNSEDNKIWHCNIPGDMHKNIYLILKPPAAAGNEPTYIFSVDANGAPTLDRGSNRLYVADAIGVNITGSNQQAHNCYGHWVPIGDSDGTGHDGGDFDGDDF